MCAQEHEQHMIAYIKFFHEIHYLYYYSMYFNTGLCLIYIFNVNSFIYSTERERECSDLTVERLPYGTKALLSRAMVVADENVLETLVLTVLSFIGTTRRMWRSVILRVLSEK